MKTIKKLIDDYSELQKNYLQYTEGHYEYERRVIINQFRESLKSLSEREGLILFMHYNDMNSKCPIWVTPEIVRHFKYYPLFNKYFYYQRS